MLAWPACEPATVARRVRAWIETLTACSRRATVRVARRVRAWIETSQHACNASAAPSSPAACGRGLKQLWRSHGMRDRRVARRVRAWIETALAKLPQCHCRRRPPRAGVD